MTRVHERLIHGVLIHTETAEVSALCFNPPRPIDREKESYIYSPKLYSEITCQDCRALLELPAQPSLRSFLLDNVALRLNIHFNMMNAQAWNENNPHETPINPDPHGEMAKEFAILTLQFNEVMKPIIKAMAKHEKRFGWDEIVEDKETN